MPRLRWGILGAAKIARDWVAPAIHSSDRGELAAVASLTPGKAETLAAPYGARVLDDYPTLLADPGIDAIYIPLPNSEHVAWTMRCLEAGKHVLCEKPIALAAAEIDGLIAARNRAGKLAAEAFMVTHHPQWSRARELVRDGAIGQLRSVQGAFSFDNRDPGNIRNRPEVGGGALRDIGVYPVVTTRFVTGAEPVAARADIDWQDGIDSSAWATLDFPEFRLDFYVSMRLAPRQVMTFHGDKGWISLAAPFNAGAYGDATVELRRDAGLIEIARFPRADQYKAQIDAFNASALDGAPYPCALEFSRGNQAAIDLIYAADAQGRG